MDLHWTASPLCTHTHINMLTHTPLPFFPLPFSFFHRFPRPASLLALSFFLLLSFSWVPHSNPSNSAISTSQIHEMTPRTKHHGDLFLVFRGQQTFVLRLRTYIAQQLLAKSVCTFRNTLQRSKSMKEVETELRIQTCAHADAFLQSSRRAHNTFKRKLSNSKSVGDDRRRNERKTPHQESWALSFSSAQ